MRLFDCSKVERIDTPIQIPRKISGATPCWVLFGESNMNITADLVEYAENLDYDDLENNISDLPAGIVAALEYDVIREQRYFISHMQHKAFQWLKNTVTIFEHKPTTLYRAQVGVLTTVNPKRKGNFKGYKDREVQTAKASQGGRQPLANERMIPNHRYTTAGRANSKRIPVLYCADDIKTAVLEVRAPIGSAVTVAKFKNSTTLKLADLRVPEELMEWNNLQSLKNALLKKYL